MQNNSKTIYLLVAKVTPPANVTTLYGTKHSAL